MNTITDIELSGDNVIELYINMYKLQKYEFVKYNINF